MSITRLTGMATGLDTDTMVKQMMQPYRARVDKVKQDKQLIQWKQDLYRDILNDVNNFKSTYFDVLRNDTYMLSNSSYAGFDITSSAASTGANATASVGAKAGVYELSDITLATTAKKSGKDGEFELSTSDKMSTILTGAVAFSIKVGTSEAVSFSYDFSDPLKDKEKTVSDILSDISKQTGLDVSYSQLGKNFTIATKTTGTSQSIELKDSAGTFLDKLFGDDPLTDVAMNTTKIGSDATVTIKNPDGITATVTKSTNNFTIDGMNYTLNGTTNTNITVTANTQKTFDKIKDFVDKYNELIDKIEKKVSEKKQYSYKPLTDEQKKEMNENDIKNWEERAKSGLLKSDSNLEKMLTELRSSIYGAVDGSLISEIGISTSKDTSKRGKLEINEIKLKEALKNNPDKVTNIFVKKSTTIPSYNPDLSVLDRKTRWEEQGVFSRFEDILKDYTRISRNKEGKKGLLIEKAGIKGDLSEFKNTLSKDLDDKDKIIKDMERKLYDRENKFYLKFAQLEKAMNQMNAQSSWLAQQLGGGQ